MTRKLVLQLTLATLSALVTGIQAYGTESLLMSCTQHGPNQMTLKFVREDGPPRDIEISGTLSTTKWTVKIAGQDKTPDTQTLVKPGEVKIHVGDKITWKVDDNAGNREHGIVFPNKEAAESLLHFDPDEGETLGPQNVNGFAWGTGKFGSGTLLAVAEVKTDPRMMSCTQHGPNQMTLKFVREDGPPRDIEISGTLSTTKWTVKIAGQDKTPDTQTLVKPGEVKIHVGDKITWKVDDNAGNREHGIVFPNKEAAESLFNFDPDEGETLGPQNVNGFAWGTGKFGSGTLLAVAEVKTDPRMMSCTQHGPNQMTLKFVREDGPPRDIEISGTLSTTKWTVKIAGQDKTPDTQTLVKPGEVKIHVGDKITWKVDDNAGNREHGIVFPNKEAAESLFNFDPDEGETLGPQNVNGFAWGTGKFGSGTLLAVARVTTGALHEENEGEDKGGE